MRGLLHKNQGLFDLTCPSAYQSSTEEGGAEWLEKRYLECLWLGETHSPLSGFLNSVAFVHRHGGESSVALNALQALLRSRSEIQSRLTSNSHEGSDLANGSVLTNLNLRGNGGNADVCLTSDRISAFEARTIMAALRSGPARVVRAEVQRSANGEVGRFSRMWLDAIFTRELQLQVLVIMCLLHYNISLPFQSNKAPEVCREESSSKSVSDRKQVGEGERTPEKETDESPTQIRKRKRKLETPHRLTGKGKVFPWQLQGRDKGRVDTEAPLSIRDMRSGTLDNSVLARQFESLIDSLCLRIATTATSIDECLVTDNQPFSPDEAGRAERPAQRQSDAEVRNIVPPFGSQSRIRENQLDDRDVLQWFCCQVIESNFSRTLPRQCGIIRSRCFVSVVATPVKKARMMGTGHRKSKAKTSTAREAPQNVKEMRSIAGAHSIHLDTASQRSVDQRPSRRFSVIPEPGPLQRSLLKEDRQSFSRTQSVAAAKRRTTLGAREVNVRRRWERSISLGPSVKTDINSEMVPIAAQADPFLGSASLRQPLSPILTSSTLVIDTPAKIKQVNILPTRKRSISRKHGVSSQPSVNVENRDHRTSICFGRESQGPFESRDDVMTCPTSIDVTVAERDTTPSDFPEGEDELIDESLHAAFNDDMSDDGGVVDDDVFKTFRDWLGPDSHSKYLGDDKLSVEPQEKPKDKDEEEENEKVTLAKHIRSLPSTLFRPLNLNSTKPALSSFALSSKSSGEQPSEQSSVRKLPTGRNPFAVKY